MVWWVLLWLLFPALLLAQPPDTLWTRTYGHPGFDSGNDILLLEDGSSVVVGARDGTPALDGYVLRLDAQGDTLWSCTVADSNVYELWSVCLGHDSTFVLAGLHHGWPPGMVTGAIDASSGIVQWLHLYPELSQIEQVWDIRPTGSNQYILAGCTVFDGSLRPSAVLMRLDSVGNVIWSRLLGGPQNESLEAVVETADGGFAAAGSKNPTPSTMYFYLVRVTGAGDTLWTRVYSDSTNAWAHALAVAANGDFLLVGEVSRVTGELHHSDLQVLRVDGAGEILWQRAYGGLGDEYGYGIVATGDDEYTLCGSTSSAGAGDDDAYLLHINGSGDTLWTRTVGDGAAQYAGQVSWVAPGAYAVVGSSTSGGSREVWVARLGELLPGAVDGRENALLPDLRLRVYPNPFNSTTTLRFSLPVPSEVTLTLYDVLGREVLARDLGRLAAGEHAESVDAKGMASGIYFVRLDAGSRTVVQKIALVR